MLRCRQQSPIEWNIGEPHVEIGWEDCDKEQYQQASCEYSAGRMNDADATCNLHRPSQVDQKQRKWKKRWDDFHENLRIPEMSDSNQDEGDSIDDCQYVGKHRKWIEPVLITWLLRCSRDRLSYCLLNFRESKFEGVPFSYPFCPEACTSSSPPQVSTSSAFDTFPGTHPIHIYGE